MVGQSIVNVDYHDEGQIPEAQGCDTTEDGSYNNMILQPINWSTSNHDPSAIFVMV